MASRLAHLLAGNRKPLKLFLLDQSKIAGIGNIYSNEVMWRARLNPERQASSLNPVEIRRLHNAIGGILNRALECCLNPAPDFCDPNWWFQGLERILRVYGREGQKCSRCSRAIRRIEQGGRSTFWCAHCQR
jgi:formamidopyrimidine-DNA glycosylase